MPYRLGQSLPRPWAGYTYPKPARRGWFPTTVPPLGPQVYNVDVSHDVQVTEAIGLLKSLIRSIVHNVTVMDNIQKIGRAYLVSVSHDVTVAETIKLNRRLFLAVSHSVVVTEAFGQIGAVSHTVTVSQSITFTRVLARSVSHSVTVTQEPFINSPRALSIFHNVSVSEIYETRLATFRFEIIDDVFVNEVISGRPATFHHSVTDTVNVGQFVRVIGAVYKHTVVDTVHVSDRVNTAFNFSVVHDVNVFHSYTRKRHIEVSIVTTEELSSFFGRDMIYTITTTLEELSVWDRTVIYNRDLDTPNEIENRFDATLVIHSQGPHPVVSGVNFIYGYLVLLESVYGTIVLPLPELNDGIKHNDVIDVKRTMSGQLSAYIKKGSTKILTYTWILDYPKALELKQWALTNFSERVTLTNWKGEIWLGKIISDNITLTALSKYAGNPRQKTSVTIQFEGIKING